MRKLPRANFPGFGLFKGYPKIAAGTASGTTITFPANYFESVPTVVVSAPSGTTVPIVSSITTSGATVNVSGCYWIAYQA